ILTHLVKITLWLDKIFPCKEIENLSSEEKKVLLKYFSASNAELFEQCGLAVEESQIELDAVEPKETKEIVGENDNVDYLLFDFLDDLVYYKDAEQLIFCKFEIDITEDNGKYRLKCIAHGETLNPAKHEQKVDVKAITMHMFEVKKIDGGWEAHVLIDI
ncbi:archease, partial [Candidatus Woesearchaeota archaeon]|nr:archease [Candidatus Woesearchaeota archaeon]